MNVTSPDYKSKETYQRFVFMEQEWSDLLKKIDEWLVETVYVKLPKVKKSVIYKREFFVMDIMMHYDGEGYHVADVYCTKDMPQ